MGDIVLGIAHVIVGLCGLYMILKIIEPQETAKETMDRLWKKSLKSKKSRRMRSAP